MPVKVQGDAIIITSNPTASRLHKIGGKTSYHLVNRSPGWLYNENSWNMGKGITRRHWRLTSWPPWTKIIRLIHVMYSITTLMGPLWNKCTGRWNVISIGYERNSKNQCTVSLLDFSFALNSLYFILYPWHYHFIITSCRKLITQM